MTRLGSVALVIFALVACSSSGTQQVDPRQSQPLRPEDESLSPGRTPRQNVETPRPSLVTVYFDYDEARLRPDAKEALRRNAEYLRQVASAAVELQGNCDERGSEEYNLALGKRRAESAAQYLADLGIPETRMSTVSFGEENPAVRGSTEASWAKNRRVDFVIR